MCRNNQNLMVFEVTDFQNVSKLWHCRHWHFLSNIFINGIHIFVSFGETDLSTFLFLINLKGNGALDILTFKQS